MPGVHVPINKIKLSRVIMAVPIALWPKAVKLPAASFSPSNAQWVFMGICGKSYYHFILSC